jgi:ribonuclease G
MTRQNVTEGVREIMSRPCPTCAGEGVIKSEETIALEFERRMRHVAEKSLKRVEAFLIRMNPRVSAQFTADGARVLRQLEAETGKLFFFEGSEGIPLDHFEVVMEGAADEIAEHAVPFSEGDEVLVQVIEPHMYNVDDAVAKVDGYIISVTGGGPHVGEKRLVRIEEVGRTAATAVLVGNPPPAGDKAKEDSSEDGSLESGSRRRGRRGGRRRSRAKAELSE